jgi:hypothetical protein
LSRSLRTVVEHCSMHRASASHSIELDKVGMTGNVSHEFMWLRNALEETDRSHECIERSWRHACKEPCWWDIMCKRRSHLLRIWTLVPCDRHWCFAAIDSGREHSPSTPWFVLQCRDHGQIVSCVEDLFLPLGFSESLSIRKNPQCLVASGSFSSQGSRVDKSPRR